MKKNLFNRLLALGGISLIAGLILVAISLSLGSISDLKNLETPVKVEKSFDKLKELDIVLHNKSLQVVTSPDNKIHLTYTYWKHRDNTWLDVQEKDGRLSITGPEFIGEDFKLFGSLKTISEIMNSQSHDNYTAILALPKGLTLDKVSIDGGGFVTLDNLHIKEANILSTIIGRNVTIDKGNIIGGGDFIDSKLSNITIESYNVLSLKNTTVDHADITFYSEFNMVDSQMKNSVIQSDAGSWTGKNSTLEQTSGTFKYSPITMDNLTVLGDVKLTTAEYLVDIDLAPASENSISLDLKTSKYGALNIASALTDIEQKDQTATRQKTDSKNKLTIVNEHADIKLK